jgi:hypothetical protein
MTKSTTAKSEIRDEQFITWTMAHQQDVIARRVIDFEPIFGNQWEDKQRDLFKFFAKCFGCRLDEADRVVPKDVIDLLANVSFRTGLYVTFMVNEDLCEIDVHSVGTEPLFVHRHRTTGDEVGFQCGHSVGWLTVMYWYQHWSSDPVGAPWIADAKHVYLGWHRPTTLSSQRR